MKKTLLATGVFTSLIALASCGGSNGAGPPSTPGSSGQNAPTTTATQLVKAATGGTVTLAGNVPMTLTIPAHALAADANVTFASFTSAPPQPTGANGAALPSGATFLGGFTISTGGVPLLTPLQVTESGSGSNATGLVYLAMYNGKSGRYTIVDTATPNASGIANAGAKGYVGISSVGGSTTPYAFFSTTSASTPAPISLSVTPASPGPYAIGATETFTAAGSDANGNPYAFTPAFTLSSPAIGTLTPSATQPMSAMIAFGATQQNGYVQVADARSGLSADLNVSVESLRPASNGDTYSYTGTLTQVFSRTLPSPMPTASSTVNVAQTVTVKGNQTYQGVSNLYDFSTAETDTGSLQTTVSQSDEFEGFAPNGSLTALLDYGSNWQDEGGDTLAYVYPQPQIIDEIPEASGNTWKNTAAASVSENESNGNLGAAFSSERTYNADGTYSETSTYPAGYFNIGSPADHGELVENANGSGYYSVPLGGAGDVTFSAPASGQITVNAYFQPSPGPSDTPFFTQQIPAWFATTPVFYQESDADKGSVPMPQQCNASASFGTSGEEILQSISRLDTILGYTETTTTTTYLVPGYGAACIIMSDVLSSYYDFGGDYPLFYSPNPTTLSPYQVTTTTETLGLQQSGTNVIGASSSSKRTQLRMIRALAEHSSFAHILLQHRAAIEHSFAMSLHTNALSHKKGVR